MITITTQAEIAIKSLLPRDEEKVKRTLELLERFPQQDIKERVLKLQDTGLGDLYMMRVSPQLRLIFRYSKNQVEVIDIFTHERLEKMYG